MPIHCPECEKDDEIYKVSAIYSGGIAHGTYSGFDGTMYGSSQTVLSGRLAPPAKPSFPMLDAIFIALCFIIAGAFFLIDLAIGNSSASFAQLFAKTNLLLVVAPLGFGILLYLSDSYKVNRKMNIWTATMKVWNRCYYCKRDDIIYDPGNGTTIPIDRFRDYLKMIMEQRLR